MLYDFFKLMFHVLFVILIIWAIISLSMFFIVKYIQINELTVVCDNYDDGFTSCALSEGEGI
ncbi:hypothetical protein UFOVP1361_6 [uncultured Caudovirales phage]|uniref:Uncharacterized protein n=1 Tax=uncultured Caudovirales phage TaxID=2100421 RepID=A0A6J5RU71_9CAUD|nr:hypothetical protein UFOVP1361_6 [uncultured Caudovirales phage]